MRCVQEIYGPWVGIGRCREVVRVYEYTTDKIDGSVGRVMIETSIQYQTTDVSLKGIHVIGRRTAYRSTYRIYMDLTIFEKMKLK